MLGSKISRRWGAQGLPDDTIRINFTGSAGQSFGAFVPRGVSMTVEGDANDYFGKGLSGGHLVIYPPKQCTFTPENNIIIGNVALYGATSGDLFVRGVAGERFAVRNSGAHAVVEAIGDHGCEYMTGGRVVIIGATGRNFSAGMSGGIAYVLDQNQTFKGRCNLGMVDLETIADDDDLLLQHLLARHGELTGSTVAQELLTQWNETRSQFVKVMPRDYKRVLQAEATARAESREPEFSELIGAQ